MPFRRRVSPFPSARSSTDPGAVVSGRVLNADGTPVLGASVLYINSNPNPFGVAQKTVDTDGRYQFDYVRRSPSGPFSMRAGDPATGAFQELTTRVGFDGEHIVADLVLLGRVLESDGVTPVANASVEVDRQIGDSFEFIFETADADGNFAFFNQEPGTFELFAEDDFALSRFERVELPSDTLTLVQDIVLPPFGTVQGTVTDSTGSPVAFPEVALRNANVFFKRKETGDASGNYRFDRVAVGSYSVTFTQSGVSSSSSPLSATAVGRVDEGELELAHLVLPGVGTVFGQLAMTPIDPTAVASVESRGQESEAFPRIFEKSETVGTDGTYRVEGAPVGDVTITIDDAGAVGAAVATVVEGGETMADVTLGTATGVPIALELDPTIASDGFTQIDVDGVLLGESGFELGRVWLNDKLTPDLSSAQTEPSGQYVFGPMRAASQRVRQPHRALARKDRDDSGIREHRHITVREIHHVVARRRLGDDQTVPKEEERHFDVDRVRVLQDLQVADPALIRRHLNLPRMVDARTSDLALEWRRLTIPAGGKLIFMHFALQDDDFASASLRAQSLVSLSDPSVYSDLTAEERAAIVNFLVP